MQRPLRIPLTGALIGMVLGFVVLHPYVMILGQLLTRFKAMSWHDGGSLGGLTGMLAFELDMLPMALPFAFLGGVAGLLAGLLWQRTRRLHQLALDEERSKAALQTVKALTATMSHHLLNANMIIGGMARRCLRAGQDPECVEALQVIEEQGRTIDTVVGALRQITRIAITRDSPHDVPMIDLAKDLESRLGGLAKKDAAERP